MRVHIEGMGVLGSLLAWHLDRKKIRFSWNDTDEDVNAWSASTGCVYPSGDKIEMKAYEIWNNWHKGPAPWGKYLKNVTEQASYWFLTQKAPHEGDYKIENTVGPLRSGPFGTIQVNVQNLVKSTRDSFSDRRMSITPRGCKIVVSHGFSDKTVTHYKWGWSAEAKLKISKDLLSKCKGLRPCIDLKRGMVSPLVYAYPKPGTDSWYAGSSIFRQTSPKVLNIKTKISFWKEKLEELTSGLVKVKSVGEPIRSGWRPCGDDESLTRHLATKDGGVIYVKPMSHSGVRLGPLVIQKVLRLLDV